MPEKIVRISRPMSWRHDFIRSHEYRCHYCNRLAGSVEVGPDGKPWHVEHMNALAAGGEDAEGNLTLACERCNSLKHTLPYENFRRYARELLWVGEPSRLTVADLESLEAAFLRTDDGRWMFRATDDNYTVDLLAVGSENPCLDQAEAVGQFHASNSRRGGLNNVDFIIEAHRLMPKLIAEIHLLHAELALLRGDSQAISSVA